MTLELGPYNPCTAASKKAVTSAILKNISNDIKLFVFCTRVHRLLKDNGLYVINPLSF
jgi:hypothetical protein